MCYNFFGFRVQKQREMLHMNSNSLTILKLVCSLHTTTSIWSSTMISSLCWMPLKQLAFSHLPSSALKHSHFWIHNRLSMGWSLRYSHIWLRVKMSRDFRQISIQLLGGRAMLWSSPNGPMLSDWYCQSSHLLLQQRVFSILQHITTQQQSSLEDYLELSVMLQYHLAH